MYIPPKFKDKVDICQHGQDCPDCCFLWLGRKDRWGYPKIKLGGKDFIGTRLFFGWNNPPAGELPTGFVLHTCDKPACVNRAHLYEGEHQDNMHDMATRGRRAVRKGEQQSQSKLTAADVQDIRDMYSTGLYTHKVLCMMYPVKKSTMGRILAGQDWGSGNI